MFTPLTLALSLARERARVRVQRINPLEMTLEDDGYCFICGVKNPGGLRLTWTVNGRSTEATFLPQKSHQGWKDLVHGGLIAALLDEAMTRLAWKLEAGAVTAEMTVRYRKSARVGEALTIRGEITETRGRLMRGRATVSKEDGSLLAEAEGKILKLKP